MQLLPRPVGADTVWRVGYAGAGTKETRHMGEQRFGRVAILGLGLIGGSLGLALRERDLAATVVG